MMNVIQPAPIRSRLSRNPRQPGWDHQRRCNPDQAAALATLNRIKAQLGSEYRGRKVRWRLRSCPVCQGWYIDREYKRVHHHHARSVEAAA